jgi:hypothetical protein
MRPLMLVIALVLVAPAHAENAWVASTSIRVIDLDSGTLVGSTTVATDQVIREIAFDDTGAQAFVASMGGLFVVDTTSLGVLSRISERPTCSVDFADGTLSALHLKPAGEGLAERDQGIPSTVTLAVYDAATAAPLAQTEVHGRPLRVRRAADRLYVLDSNEAVLTVYDGAAGRLGEVDLAPDAEEGQAFLCADLGLSSDGTLAVARSSSAGSAVVLVSPATDVTDSRVTVVDVGSEHRVRGAAFAPGAGDVYAAAMGHVARLSPTTPETAWQRVGHRFAAVEVSPSGAYLVMATPVFDEQRGTGGVLVADPEGRPLRVIELADISPYTLAVQP